MGRVVIVGLGWTWYKFTTWTNLIKSQNEAPNVDLRIFISYFLENVIVKVDIRTLDVSVENIKITYHFGYKPSSVT